MATEQPDNESLTHANSIEELFLAAKSKEDLIQMIMSLKYELYENHKYILDLERECEEMADERLEV